MSKKTKSDTYSSPPGLLRRLAAILYDTLLLVGLFFFATALALLFRGGAPIASNDPFYSAYLAFVAYLFFGWFWTHGGQTLGMRAWKIRLRSTLGPEISWSQSLLRFLAATVSWAALGLGFAWVLISKEHKSWHDSFSETEVVWAEKN